MTDIHDNSIARQERQDILDRVGRFMDCLPNLQEQIWLICLFRDLEALSDTEALDLIIEASSH